MPKEKPVLGVPGISSCGSDCGLALPLVTSPREGLSSIRMPSSVVGGVRGRAGIDVPNVNPGFCTSGRVGTGLVNEKLPGLALGLVSDFVACKPNKNPLGAPVGVVVVEPKVRPVDATAAFSTIEGVVEGAPNVNAPFSAVEGAAVVDSLTGWLKGKGADPPAGGLDDSVGGADLSTDTDVDVSEGLF